MTYPYDKGAKPGLARSVWELAGIALVLTVVTVPWFIGVVWLVSRV